MKAITMALAISNNINFSQSFESLKTLKLFIDTCSQIVVGKGDRVELALVAMLARGHILIEDVPGTGKTTLAKVLSALLGAEMKRVQFTNDLLPSDIIGSSVFHPPTSQFQFKKGPIFSQLFLGDELNRASPRTQSACLQAMEEGRISIDGVDLPLPEGFVFIATQNPTESAGVFPLPESQLDRFMICFSLGSLDSKYEHELLLGKDRLAMIETLEPLLSFEELRNLQNLIVDFVQISPKIATYILNLASGIRTRGVGLSTRSLISLSRAAKALAFLRGRDFVIPEDVKTMLIPCFAHRMRGALSRTDAKAHIEKVSLETAVPL